MIVQAMPWPPSAAMSDLSDFPLIARTETVEGGTIPLLGLDLSDYQRIFVAIDGVRVDTDNTQIGLRISVDGVVQASGYRYHKTAFSSSSPAPSSYSSSAGDRTLLSTNVSSAAGHSSSWSVCISNLSSSLFKTIVFDEGRMISNAPGSAMYGSVGGGSLDVTGEIDGFHLIPDNTGRITEGSVEVYGIKNGPRTPTEARLVSLWVGALT